MKVFALTIVAIFGIAAILIYRKNAQENKAKQRAATQQFIDEEGYLPIQQPGEILRRDLLDGNFPLQAYRDPELLAEYEKLPVKVIYYNEDRLSQEQKNLLFGTGTIHIYNRSNYTAPVYSAPEAISQLQHDIPKPNRYDYVSAWDYWRV